MNSFYLDKAVLEHMYLQENKSMQQIANELGVAVGSVFNWCKKYGIQSRPRHKGFLSKHHTSEAKEKISRVLKGRVFTDEHRLRIAQGHKLEGSGHIKRRVDGYISIYFPNHPRSTKDGYVMEHQLVMEKHIGRYLEADEVVHHKNHKRDDNRIENLELMTFNEHARFHMTERHKKRRGEL